MRTHAWIGAVIAALMAATAGRGVEPPCCEPARDGFLQRVAPAGGWHPYGGGLLRWWPRDCFPCCGAPDDYCRKPLPRLCWPPYPPYYIWGPPEVCHPPYGCRPANREAHQTSEEKVGLSTVTVPAAALRSAAVALDSLGPDRSVCYCVFK